jgi:hypothetical protein
MLLTEIYDAAIPGFTDQSQDNSVTKLSDVRKSRLTLAQINALRQMNDVRKFEEEQRLGDIQRQFAPPKTSM